MSIYSLLAGVFLVFAATTTPAIAPQMVSPPSVRELIVKWADYYKVDVATSLRIARCESAFSPTANGDGGLAYGVYQFHRSTFDHFSQELGQEMSYHNTEDNIQLANFAFSKGYYSHWTCQ